MSVRAKFKVESITKHVWSPDAVTVKLGAVTSGSDENKSWSKYTPSGVLELQITNPEASDQFTLGAEFYLDFTSITPAVPDQEPSPAPVMPAPATPEEDPPAPEEDPPAPEEDTVP